MFQLLFRINNTNQLIERDRDNFKSVFEQGNPDIYTKLKSLSTTISSNELRMTSMLKINLNTKEMASILKITSKSEI